MTYSFFHNLKTKREKIFTSTLRTSIFSFSRVTLEIQISFWYLCCFFLNTYWCNFVLSWWGAELSRGKQKLSLNFEDIEEIKNFKKSSKQTRIVIDYLIVYLFLILQYLFCGKIFPTFIRFIHIVFFFRIHINFFFFFS